MNSKPKNKKKRQISFGNGFVLNKSIVRVIATVDALVEKESPSCLLLKWTSENNEWGSFDQNWPAIRIWEDEDSLYFMGPDGRVAYVIGDDEGEEYIDNSKLGPLSRGPLCDLTRIGKHMYACGMSRQVYQLKSKGTWEHIDQGMVTDGINVCGFNSISGLTEELIIAVGFSGEIWMQKKSKWKQLDSPTNLILNCVRFVDHNCAYACGQNGIVLKGKEARWKVIENNVTKDNIVSMQIFNGKVWFATRKGLFRLDENDHIYDVTPKNIETLGHIHANDGAMWLFGQKHIYSTEDGSLWAERL